MLFSSLNGRHFRFPPPLASCSFHIPHSSIWVTAGGFPIVPHLDHRLEAYLSSDRFQLSSRLLRFTLNSNPERFKNSEESEPCKTYWAEMIGTGRRARMKANIVHEVYVQRKSHALTSQCCDVYMRKCVQVSICKDGGCDCAAARN